MEGDLPTYDDLRHVDRTVLWGLLEESGTPAWTASGYQHRWERGRATWSAVVDALGHAARGARPSQLRSTPPRWLVPLVRELLTTLSTSWSQGEAFRPVRLLERLGLVGLEADDTYVLAIVSGLGDRWNRDDRAVDLRADPDLVERALWRVFEVEGGGEVSLANVDKFSQPEGTWQQTFLTLVGDGTLPRERVLTGCLDALQRDFSAYRAGWFASTYAALEPTTEEQARHQTRFRRLLRSSVPATVSVAVRRLRALGRLGLLEDEETLAAVEPALLSPVKGTAVEAVRLLTDVAARHPELVPGVCASAAVALDHPHADVQKAAVRLLERYGAGAAVRSGSPASSRRSSGWWTGRLPRRVPRARRPLTRHLLSDRPPPAPAAPVKAGDLLGRLAALLEGAGDPVEVEMVLAGLASCPDADGAGAAAPARGGRAGARAAGGCAARVAAGAARPPGAGGRGRDAGRPAGRRCHTGVPGQPPGRGGTGARGGGAALHAARHP